MTNQMLTRTLAFCIIAILVISQNAYTQAPDTLWTKTLGYDGKEYFTSVEKTTDGGFILGGFTESFFSDSSAYWLMQLDNNGNTVWDKVFRADEKYDNQHAFQTSDGGFAIAGDGDPWLIKTDADGNVTWQQATSILGSSVKMESAEETTDNGFIACGSAGGDGVDNAFIAKTNSLGVPEWLKTFSSEHDMRAMKAIETSDGGFAVAGTKQHPTGGGVNHGWLQKLSAAGDSLWSVVYGNTSDAKFNKLQETADGGFILIGRITAAGDSTSDIYLVKTNSTGAVEWEKTYGGLNDDEGIAVIQTSDLGFTFIAMGAVEPEGDEGGLVVHTTASGDTVWTLITGDPENFIVGLDLVEISENEYLVAGARIDWDSGEAFGWLIRLGSSVSVDENQSEISEYTLKQNFPNPFYPVTTIEFSIPKTEFITLKIYNLLGKEVTTLVSENLRAGIYKYEWDANGFASGVHYYRLETDKGFVQSKKLILLK